jgi:hypothetical protein
VKGEVSAGMLEMINHLYVIHHYYSLDLSLFHAIAFTPLPDSQPIAQLLFLKPHLHDASWIARVKSRDCARRLFVQVE